MKSVAAAGLLLLTAACAALPPQSFDAANPADPDAAVAPTPYRSTLGSYRSQRPVEPGDWMDTNERVTPQRKPGQ